MQAVAAAVAGVMVRPTVAAVPRTSPGERPGAMGDSAGEDAGDPAIALASLRASRRAQRARKKARKKAAKQAAAAPSAERRDDSPPPREDDRMNLDDGGAGLSVGSGEVRTAVPAPLVAPPENEQLLPLPPPPEPRADAQPRDLDGWSLASSSVATSLHTQDALAWISGRDQGPSAGRVRRTGRALQPRAAEPYSRAGHGRGQSSR